MPFAFGSSGSVPNGAVITTVANPGVVSGRTYIFKSYWHNFQSDTTGKTVYTVTPGKTLYVTSIVLSAGVPTVAIRDGSTTYPADSATTDSCLMMDSLVANGVNTNLTVTFAVPLMFSTSVCLCYNYNVAATNHVSVSFVGWEE